MPYNILDIQNKDMIDILMNDDLKYFIKTHYDIDHIYLKKYDYVDTVIVE